MEDDNGLSHEDNRGVDWARLFSFDTPPAEIVIRGTIIYVTIYALLRVVLKRESGTNGITDLIVVVLIADAAQNGMAGGYRSVSDGILLVSVIIGWSFLLNWAAHRWTWAARIIRPGSLRSEEHTSELQSRGHVVCRLLL